MSGERTRLRSSVAFLIEREPRPTAMVDTRDGSVVFANKRMRALLGRDHERSTPFAQGSRQSLANPRTIHLADLRVSGPTGEFELSVEVQPVTGEPTLVMLVVLSATPVTRGSLPMTELMYEISTSDFGAIEWSLPQNWQGKLLQGTKCYASVMNRASVCSDCPAERVGTEGSRVTSVVRQKSGGAFLAVARRGTRNNVQVGLCKLDAPLAGKLLDAHVAEIGAGTLSPRENEVVRLLLRGRSVSDIAMTLGVSLSTAKFHQANVLRKLGARSRADLLQRFL